MAVGPAAPQPAVANSSANSWPSLAALNSWPLPMGPAAVVARRFAVRHGGEEAGRVNGGAAVPARFSMVRGSASEGRTRGGAGVPARPSQVLGGASAERASAVAIGPRSSGARGPIGMGEKRWMGKGQYGHFRSWIPVVRASPPLTTNRTWTEEHCGKENLTAGYIGASQIFWGMEVDNTLHKGRQVKVSI